jgi:hypothetical protein
MSEGKNEADQESLGVTPSGVVITEELAEHWATEFENEDIDLTKLERRYVVWSQPVEHAPDSGVAFPLSSPEVDAIRMRAKREGRQFSDLLRDALES